MKQSVLLDPLVWTVEVAVLTRELVLVNEEGPWFVSGQMFFLLSLRAASRGLFG